ncbi:MAG: cell envelope integrity EipB family protein [Bradyrhizobiaceae bacterium]|nr:cell envelope integrity EipB family protein [Bradyrhizobiaceae bacterium]
MKRVQIASQLAAAGLAGLMVSLAAGAPADAAPVLAPHKAIYDLKLVKSQGKRPVEAVRGRILYDFTGSSCEGYALSFRQVSEIDNGEGKVALSDLRAATWEEGDARSFRFNSENKVNEQVVETVDGNAGRGKSGVSVTLSKPKSKAFDLDAAIAFPTEHVRRIIEAAEAGNKLLELSVFDGSESGDKVFSTLTVIGHVINPGEKAPDDAAAGNPALAGLRRWPVTISYFEQGTPRTGEQTPAYAIGFELYENGISRALTLDYGDFIVSGTMSQLDLKDTAACK